MDLKETNPTNYNSMGMYDGDTIINTHANSPDRYALYKGNPAPRAPIRPPSSAQYDVEQNNEIGSMSRSSESMNDPSIRNYYSGNVDTNRRVSNPRTSSAAKIAPEQNLEEGGCIPRLSQFCSSVRMLRLPMWAIILSLLLLLALLTFATVLFYKYLALLMALKRHAEVGGGTLLTPAISTTYYPPIITLTTSGKPNPSRFPIFWQTSDFPLGNITIQTTTSQSSTTSSSETTEATSQSPETSTEQTTSTTEMDTDETDETDYPPTFLPPPSSFPTEVSTISTTTETEYTSEEPSEEPTDPETTFIPTEPSVFPEETSSTPSTETPFYPDTTESYETPPFYPEPTVEENTSTLRPLTTTETTTEISVSSEEPLNESTFETEEVETTTTSNVPPSFEPETTTEDNFPFFPPEESGTSIEPTEITTGAVSDFSPSETPETELPSSTDFETSTTPISDIPDTDRSSTTDQNPEDFHTSEFPLPEGETVSTFMPETTEYPVEVLDEDETSETEFPFPAPPTFEPAEPSVSQSLLPFPPTQSPSLITSEFTTIPILETFETIETSSESNVPTISPSETLESETFTQTTVLKETQSTLPPEEEEPLNPVPPVSPNPPIIGANDTICQDPLDVFQCDSGEKTIPCNQYCNGVLNCADGSDEKETCKCRVDEKVCRTGGCIEQFKFCDGKHDCPHPNDFSDEIDCECKSIEFKCHNGLCKERGAVYCNGINDCGDNSDEPENCVCAEDQFECPSGRIDSVENNGLGKCISNYQKCDGAIDCKLKEDELNCPCPEDTHFRCESDQICLINSRKCDGRPDCEDGSDELNCPTPSEK